jgi:hypothetical protein
MSKQGIVMAASVFEKIQNTAVELFELGSKDAKHLEWQQDILLARLFNDSATVADLKRSFERLSMMETESTLRRSTVDNALRAIAEVASISEDPAGLRELRERVEYLIKRRQP